MKQGFYFFVKFGSVLIYTLIYLLYLTCIFIKNPLRFYWEKIFYWEKHERFLKNFSVENLETTPSTFLSKFYFENHLSRIINYWSSIFTLYLTWGEFSLVCFLFVFFFSCFLSSFFFFFYRYFPWQKLTIHTNVFHFHQLTNFHLVHRNFYFFFLVDLFIIARLIADTTCSPQRLHFLCIFIDAIKSELLALTFQSQRGFFNFFKWEMRDVSFFYKRLGEE